MSDIPTKNASGRYDNVDFTKAVGFQHPPVRASYLRRDVLLFANAIGIPYDELHFLYELHPNFAPFPTFSTNLYFKQTSADVYDFFARAISAAVPGVPPFDGARSVDGERGIEIINPLPVSSEGLDLEISNKVLGVYDKGGNMILEAEQTLHDVISGTVYAKLTSTAFGIGQGGYGGPKGPSKPSYNPPKRAPDAVHVFHTSREQALLYRLCGDYNPLHGDDEFGRRSGFKGAILQGLGTWNIAAHGVLRELGEADPSRFKSFGARFKSVVYPGDVLETRMWKMGVSDGCEDVIFETIVAGDGRVALSNGLCRIKLPSSKSKL